MLRSGRVSNTMQPGAAVGRFRVVSLLGAGGMGQVYLARDESLDRAVALKILPPDLIKNDERVRRFVQEAKAASSLNHPHIVTVYEVGEVDIDGQRLHFIAMELVNGTTLKDLIHHSQADLRTLLRYLSQAAEGLAKAHAAGIVHRDLKPENVMVTTDGYAKVLDFGLAKLTEAAPGANDLTSAPTAMAKGTGAGMILGTVGYMSPEQVQGRTIDQRSDIFSFGCILYEAATRQRPFTADSDIETLHKILKEKPAPIEELNPQVPGELRRLIRRCLHKNADQRLQSMKDLSLELAEIAEEYDTLSLSSGSGSKVSGSDPLLLTPARSRWDRLGPIAAVLAVVALAAVGWVWFGGGFGSSSANKTLGDLQITRLVNITDMGNLVVSSDGQYLAYTLDQREGARLLLRQVATSQEVELVPAQDAGISLTVRAFSPDGGYLYYAQQTPGALFRVAIVGGAVRRIADGNFHRETLSPDGSQFTGRPTDTRDHSMLIVNTDGTGVRTLTTLPTEVFRSAWSPDGKFIVAAVQGAPAPGNPQTSSRRRLIAISATDGAQRPLGSKEWGIWSLAWLPDGSGLIVSAQEMGSANNQLWLVSWPDGGVRRITNDTTEYGEVQVLADGKTIVATQSGSETTLWVAPAGRVDAAVRVSGESVAVPTALSNGRALFTTGTRDQGAIWSMAADGSDRQRLSPERLSASGPIPAALADVIVFTSGTRGALQVWRMDLDGGRLAEVPGGAGKRALAISPDGKTVYFAKEPGGGAGRDPSGGAGQRVVWKMPMSGGPEERVGDSDSARPRFSPDGRYFFVYHDAGGRREGRIGGREGGGRGGGRARGGGGGGVDVFTVDGGRFLRNLELPVELGPNLKWAPSSDALTSIRGTGADRSIWRVPIDGRPAEQITRLPPGQLGLGYEWARDGSLFFGRSERQSSQILLIRNFR